MTEKKIKLIYMYYDKTEKMAIDFKTVSAKVNYGGPSQRQAPCTDLPLDVLG